MEIEPLFDMTDRVLGTTPGQMRSEDFIRKLNEVVDECTLLLPEIRFRQYHILQLYGMSASIRKEVGGLRRFLEENIDQYTLHLDVRFFTKEELYPPLVLQQVWSQVLGSFLDEEVADDAAFGIVWEMLHGSLQKLWEELWDNTYPRNYEIDRTTKLNLKGFITMVGSRKAIEFGSRVARGVTNLNPGQTRENSLAFVYGRVRVDLSLLTEADLRVWEALCKLPYWDSESQLRYARVTRSTFSTSKKKLLYLQLLHPQREFSQQALGMLNTVMLQFVDGIDHHEFPAFPILHHTYVFANFQRVRMFRFLTPGKRQLETWVGGLPAKTVVGVEREELKFRSMRPTLYKLKTQSWGLGEPLTSFSEPSEKAEMTMLVRRVVLEMFRNDFRREGIYKKLGGNRNRVLGTVKMLEEGGTVWRQYEMAFLTTLDRVLVFFRGGEDDYRYFIKRFASRVPYAMLSFCDEVSGGHTFAAGVLGLPPAQSRAMVRMMFSTYPDIRIMTLASNPKFYTTVNMGVRKEGWRCRLPDLG